jgi:hypothetical protein
VAGVQVPLLPELDPPPAATRRSRFPDGSWPGISAVFAAVETAAGVPAVAVGKLEPYIFDIARSLLGERQRMAIVGDNLASDIAGAKRSRAHDDPPPRRHDDASASAKLDLVVADLAALAAEINRAPPEAPALKMTQP